MLEQLEYLPFPDGDDPDAKTKRIERQLGKLEYANVDVKIGDETRKSADLFKAGNADAVRIYLRGKSARDADQWNDLGCAQAWNHEWDAATNSLGQSGKNQNDAAKKRAKKNIAVVAKAKAVESA